MEGIRVYQPGDRLGSQLDEIFRVSNICFSTSEKKISIDFGALSFIHPNFILPLRVLKEFLQEEDKEVSFINLPDSLHLYFSTIHFEKTFNPSISTDWETVLKSYESKTYLPIIALPLNNEKLIDDVISVLTTVLTNQLQCGPMKAPLSYFFSELFDNASTHANTRRAYCMCQHYPQKGYMDISICDAGKGFLQSYIDHGKYPIATHAEAIEKAVSGLSTKDIEGNRGFGLKTSRTLITDGLKGKVAISSGSATLLHDETGEQILNHKRLIWKGVLINIRLYPNNSIKIVNYYS